MLSRVAVLAAAVLGAVRGERGHTPGLHEDHHADRLHGAAIGPALLRGHHRADPQLLPAGAKLAREYATEATGGPGGTVAPTLSLTMGAPASFGAFAPGVDREYTATSTANVISTAGDAALTVPDPGHLTNGSYSLPEPLRVELNPASWTGPVSNAAVAITFRQHIGATDPLRTGSYAKTLTFTLSTTNP
jgi:hypothetical protein